MSKTIVLGGGCFWCIEAIYQRVKGIDSVVSGYAGGDSESPTYHDHDNHAEVVELTYDEKQIDLRTILEIFFHIHNPTTLNRQGNDVGTQYRSIILYGNDEERTIAEEVRDASKELWDEPIVTEIKKLKQFYKAEDYHQDYYNQNPGNPYCQVIINPKISKFEQTFSEYLK